MFQNFEPVSDPSFAGTHLPLLRAEMKKQNLDGFVIPHDDEYQNEYIPEYAQRLRWVSGFSGSAGAAVVFMDRAVVFSDGRYRLQLRQEVDSNYFEFADSTETPLDQWLAQHAPKGARIGYDPMLHPSASVKKLKKAAEKAGFVLTPVQNNPVDLAWKDQPEKPTAPAFPHDVKFAGKSSEEKRRDIAEAINKAGADAVLIAAPPSVAWLFNIRGRDIARTPLPLARAILHKNAKATLFIAPEKVSDRLRAFLGDSVDIRTEDELGAALEKLGRNGARISVDPALSPSKFADDLAKAGAAVMELDDPCALPRAVKNDVELRGTRNAHIRDGAAIAQFLHWIETNAPHGDVDEIAAAKKLEEFRIAAGGLQDISFDTISGSGPNGAVVHYKVSTKTNRKLRSGELYLIDSGAQYPDGTTDITRTAPIGPPTPEMRDRFTRVLKGHIALAAARFPAGTRGSQLDALARKPLWDAGLDYDHGTGHGVGSFLGVHEGPQRIAKTANDQELKPGMILSNEPGFYKPGAFGIRIENLLVVTPLQPVAGGERDMMSFETITMAPISLELIDMGLLTQEERCWLNDYHARVWKNLKPLLPAAMHEWFKSATREI
jgi:Xaa-Pro aminopeptidase